MDFYGRLFGEIFGDVVEDIELVVFDSVEAIIACGDFFNLLLFFVGINEAILPDVFSSSQRPSRSAVVSEPDVRSSPAL